MSWIKRNLLFVIGGIVAAGLLAWAGFYSYTRYNRNSEVLEKLNAQYEELNRLNNLKPHPGNAKVDNIAAAREQKDTINKVIDRLDRQFQKIPAIPSAEKVTSEEYAAALRRTIDQLQRDAINAGVSLQPKYSFSFEAQRPLVRFAPGSLEPLAAQLGEVKAICDVLNSAKVNSLDSIRRCRVSPDDLNGPLTDYLDVLAVTNDLAVMTPYEVSFRCFSPELAQVIAHFASSPYALVVKTVNVEPAPAVGATDASVAGAPAYTPVAPPPGFGRPRYDDDVAGARPAAPAYTAAPVAAQPAARGGIQAFINERQLRVTILLEVVKLLPKQQQ